MYLIADGEPLAFWTHAYQNLEMTKGHASRVKNRLEKLNVLVKVSISELKGFYPWVYAACTQNYISDFYYFLDREGYNRLVIEVDTAGMKDREIAARIEERKDKMVNIFTRYEKGEVLSLKGDVPKRKGLFVPSAGILRDRLRQVDTYVKCTHCSRKEAILICLKIADEDHKRLGGSGFEPLIAHAESMPDDEKHLQPAKPGLYINVTKIGKLLGVTGQKVNKGLDTLGYQKSSGSEHMPTEIGTPYSRWEEVKITKDDGTSISKYHLIWSADIVDLLRVHFEAEQATLPECFS